MICFSWCRVAFLDRSIFLVTVRDLKRTRRALKNYFQIESMLSFLSYTARYTERKSRSCGQMKLLNKYKNSFGLS